ncbi:hypothetical protein [Paraflavitalea speifideaquila]|uniref:hypothetical protein n=1 Tax=Paraflavitalea speifideaquila TaxID=3076558 RepID=UPI0028E4441B|nr:hypothetical protein [Paraflavitalea speifideiaquila]
MAYPNAQTLFPHAELKSICEMPDGDRWFGSGYEGLVRQSNNKLQYFYKDGGYGDKTFCVCTLVKGRSLDYRR